MTGKSLSLQQFDDLPDGALVSVRYAAKVCDVSEATAWRWIAKGVLPKPRKLAGTSRLNVGELRRAIGGQPVE